MISGASVTCFVIVLSNVPSVPGMGDSHFSRNCRIVGGLHHVAATPL
jgi:hypothetical protein